MPGSDPNCCDSVFGENDIITEDACLIAAPTTPGVTPFNISQLLHPGQSRRPHSSMGLAASLGLDELALPPKSPLPGIRRPRQRTFSTSATISTEREPIIRACKRTIYTAGRPPWYDSQGQQVLILGLVGLYLIVISQVEPFVIGICGGSASGKTTVANKIISELGVPWVTLLSMDSFYKVLNEKQHEMAALNEVRQ